MKIYCSLLALLLVWFGAPEETRNIYVGDIITLNVTAKGISAEQLKEEFQNFEIVEFQNKSGEFLLSIRTFESGEHRIPLGDKEIEIIVGSTLNDIQREGIFEGEERVINPGPVMPDMSNYYNFNNFKLRNTWMYPSSFLDLNTTKRIQLQSWTVREA